MDQIEKLINTLPAIDLHIEEPQLQYYSNFTDYSEQSLMINLENIIQDDDTL